MDSFQRASPPAAAPGPPLHPAADGDRRRQFRLELSPRTMVSLLLVGAALWLLIRLWPVLLVLVVALLVAGTLSPAVRWLEEKRVGRGLGIAIVFTVFFIFTILLVALTIPTLVSQTAALLEHEPAEQAAAIAVEISAERQKDESHESSSQESARRLPP